MFLKINNEINLKPFSIMFLDNCKTTHARLWYIIQAQVELKVCQWAELTHLGPLNRAASDRHQGLVRDCRWRRSSVTVEISLKEFKATFSLKSRDNSSIQSTRRSVEAYANRDVFYLQSSNTTLLYKHVDLCSKDRDSKRAPKHSAIKLTSSF